MFNINLLSSVMATLSKQPPPSYYDVVGDQAASKGIAAGVLPPDAPGGPSAPPHYAQEQTGPSQPQVYYPAMGPLFVQPATQPLDVPSGSSNHPYNAQEPTLTPYPLVFNLPYTAGTIGQPSQPLYIPLLPRIQPPAQPTAAPQPRVHYRRASDPGGQPQVSFTPVHLRTQPPTAEPTVNARPQVYYRPTAEQSEPSYSSPQWQRVQPSAQTNSHPAAVSSDAYVFG